MSYVIALVLPDQQLVKSVSIIPSQILQQSWGADAYNLQVAKGVFPMGLWKHA